MTGTNPKDFEKFVKLLPKNILENIWFFPIRMQSKNPEVPANSRLKGNSENRIRMDFALARLKRGANVGIYAIEKGLMFLDLDVSDGKLLASPELIEKLSKTLTVQTRNGGLQYYYLNNSMYANQLIHEAGKVVGELRTDWWYVVSVGSYVPPNAQNAGGDGTYRLISGNQQICEFQDPNLNLMLREEKLKKENNNNIKYDHTKIENQITTGKHLRELAASGIENRRRIKCMAELML